MGALVRRLSASIGPVVTLVRGSSRGDAAVAAAGWVPAPRPGACAAGRRRPGWTVVKLPLSARTLVLALWPRRRTPAATFVPVCGVCFAHDRVQRKIRLEVCDLGD